MPNPIVPSALVMLTLYVLPHKATDGQAATLMRPRKGFSLDPFCRARFFYSLRRVEAGRSLPRPSGNTLTATCRAALAMRWSQSGRHPSDAWVVMRQAPAPRGQTRLPEKRGQPGSDFYRKYSTPPSKSLCSWLP